MKLRSLTNLFMLLVVFWVFQGCTKVEVAGGEEAVLIVQPWIFGGGGVEPTPVETGLEWAAATTSYKIYDIKPIQYTEVFDDLITSDNNPVDFKTYIELQIVEGTSPSLHEKFGPSWYAIKIKEKFRTLIRNFARTQKMFSLTTDPAVTLEMASEVKQDMIEYIAGLGIKVNTNRVNVGKVSPPKAVLEETIRTAAQVQRNKTEQAGATTELSRAKRETNRALADKAYRTNFGMTVTQYLKARELDIQEEMIEMANGKSDVKILLNGGAIPMFGM